MVYVRAGGSYICKLRNLFHDWFVMASWVSLKVGVDFWSLSTGERKWSCGGVDLEPLPRRLTRHPSTYSSDRYTKQWRYWYSTHLRLCDGEFQSTPVPLFDSRLRIVFPELTPVASEHFCTRFVHDRILSQTISAVWTVIRAFPSNYVDHISSHYVDRTPLLLYLVLGGCNSLYLNDFSSIRSLSSVKGIPSCIWWWKICATTDSHVSGYPECRLSILLWYLERNFEWNRQTNIREAILAVCDNKIKKGQ